MGKTQALNEKKPNKKISTLIAEINEKELKIKMIEGFSKLSTKESVK